MNLRPSAGVADFVRMQALASASFGRGFWHAGDLAWWVRFQTHLEASALTTLAEDSRGTLLGWMRLHSNGWFAAVAANPDDAEVLSALVQAAIDTAARLVAYGDPPAEGRIYCECEDDESVFAAVLQQHGFSDSSGSDGFGEFTRRSLDDLPAPVLPDGFRFSGVDDSLLAERIECHRAAFAPSALEIVGFRRVRRTWPYRDDLDRVVIAPDGRVAASCLAWYDDGNGWGLLEPVGTRPEFRRRGLASAVCLDALHHLKAAGAHSSQVGCESGSAGCATYHSIGFETVHRTHAFARAVA